MELLEAIKLLEEMEQRANKYNEPYFADMSALVRHEIQAYLAKK